MTDFTRFEKLAEIKNMIKNLEAEAKEIQKEIFQVHNGTPPKKVKTDYGTLTLSTRANYSLRSKDQVIKTIGQDMYNAISTVTLPAIKKAAGSVLSNKLVVEGAFEVGMPSVYYTLRK